VRPRSKNPTQCRKKAGEQHPCQGTSKSKGSCERGESGVAKTASNGPVKGKHSREKNRNGLTKVKKRGEFGGKHIKGNEDRGKDLLESKHSTQV